MLFSSLSGGQLALRTLKEFTLATVLEEKGAVRHWQSLFFIRGLAEICWQLKDCRIWDEGLRITNTRSSD